jgi:RNA polymerase sigma-70 factor (ECF subfamily)
MGSAATDVLPFVELRPLIAWINGLSAFAALRSEAGLDDDRDAIEAAKRGDREAYEQLVRRYMKRALSISWGIVRNAHDAEDLTQEAFVRAFEKIGSFRSTERFGPWLFRIVTNLSLDLLRSAKRHPTEEVPATLRSADRTDGIPSETMAARIDAAIESLPEMQRLVARLFLVEELSHGEIAAITGLSDGTIRSHLSHARRKLQRELEDLREAQQ